MYIGLGKHRVVKGSEIIGIFDLDGTTVSKRTREFLSFNEKQGKVSVASRDLPKSFVVCKNKKGEDMIYLSQISTSTLSKRAEK